MKNLFREVLLVLLVCFSLSAAADLSIAERLAALPRYETLHEAAIYAAARTEKCSRYYECAAVIAQDPAGKFVVGGMHTDYQSDSVETPTHVLRGWTLAADIHSHPCVPEHYTEYFSANDIIASITSRTTSYMVDFCTGDVHEFIPGTTKPDEVQVEDRWLTGGVVVGHVAAFPDDPKAVLGL